MLRRMVPFAACIAACALGGVSVAVSQTAAPPASQPAKPVESKPVEAKSHNDAAVSAEFAKRAKVIRHKAAEFLIAAQGPEGGWNGAFGPGISALVLKALMREPDVGPRCLTVRRGVEFVLRSQRDDGGIYSGEGLHKNYDTSVVLSMLAALKDPAHEKIIKAAQDFLKKIQWDEGEDKSVDDPWYGGVGYGTGRRPDLSNTQMMLEALHDSGLPPDDPAYKKALVFIARCQMQGETNDQPFAKGSTDGGFIYTANNGGDSKAGEIDVDGRETFRTYGSMTYSGFKSMIYCGLTKDDPRVKAALDWIKRNWTLDHNPNMPERQSNEGLYYFYHVFARALSASGERVVRDANGKEHNWREELIEKLEQLQRPDGSFVNDKDRWMEGLPTLVTAYVLLALQAADETIAN